MSGSVTSPGPTSATKSGRDYIAQSWNPETAAAKPATWISSERKFERSPLRGLGYSNLLGATWGVRGASLERHERMEATISEENPDCGTSQYVAEEVHAQNNS